MLRILLINTLYPPSQVGGAERSVKIISESLVKHNYEAVVISLSDQQAEEIINGVKVYRIELKNIYWPFEKETQKSLLSPLWHIIDAYNPWMRKEVERIIKSEKPDIIHTHNLQGFSTNIWNIGAKLSIPIVHTLRDYWLRCPKTTMYKNNQICKTPCLDCKFLSLPKKLNTNTVHGVIGISKFILNNHLEAGYFDKSLITSIIYNTVNLKSKIESQTKLKENDFKIGFLGRLSESKGVKMLVDSLKDLEISLLLGGRGDEKILEYIEELNASNIEYLGFVDPKDFFEKINVLIVPSKWNEPFGRVVIEAFMNGTPVIVNNRGGLAEIVDDGINGFVIEMNQTSIIKTINKFKENLQMQNEMRKQAYIKAHSFGIDQSISKHIEFYKNVIDLYKQ